MYANSHQFGDGQQGIRVERRKCSLLDTLLATSDKIKSKSTECSACGKDSKLRCVRCQTSYCDKECQTTHWKQGHKKECPRRCQIMRLGNFDWKRFDRFRHFQSLASPGHLV
ncbi:hypothetical protein BD779DRAFT_1762736 [Infundibulicybe gibba]|nr:hypothetical protein BD779DRAFT_1762736 [Infundibulicybe gibba]